MTTYPNTPRFALFPQPVPVDEKGKHPTIRRYTLTRLTAPQSPERRFDYLRRPHD